MLGTIQGIYVVKAERLRLKGGDFYTDSRNGKVYRLNEDDKGSWYVSTREDDEIVKPFLYQNERQLNIHSSEKLPIPVVI